ncbi:hypothetical protein JWG44_09545 [Leptospira sp. 201903071]|uniref:hypothetical protein n=1 Tax=Leptospira ainazelensis TaxID=2810034 RepID=UPI001965D984|nr:hypothetical protein [Leptospira ainazelensis]MBM9500489.1 hypothetical protein [Leptospira ainazelensis]
MSRNTKRWTAFFGTIGFTTALLCFTIMLSGENCPAFPISEKTASSDLPPCHQQEKPDPNGETSPNCSSCHFEVSQESIQPKTPDLHPNWETVLSTFSELFFQGWKLGKNFEFSLMETRSFNPHKFVLLSIASIRILT